MGTFILIVHIIICLCLIGIVLLQTAKGSALSGLFGGGGGGESIFGGGGGNPFLRKVTTGLAIAFFTTSLVLAIRASKQPRKSIIEKATPHQSALPEVKDESTQSPDTSKLSEDRPPSESKPVKSEVEPVK